jgi:hypothetical protein
MRVQRDEGVTTRSLSGSGAWISVQLTRASVVSGLAVRRRIGMIRIIPNHEAAK